MTPKNPKIVKNLQHLIHKTNAGNNKFVISIGKGKIVSHKWIYYDGITRKFNIFLEDNTEQELHISEMHNIKKTNIGKAIELGCLYQSQ